MPDRAAIERELAELRKISTSIDDRIRFLQGLIEDEQEKRYNTLKQASSDGKLYNGVLANDLKPYVQEWIDRGYTIRALADKANLNEETIYKVMRGGDGMLRIATADALLNALELPHIFNEIVPEPPESQYYEE